jgi:hypothetical protein
MEYMSQEQYKAYHSKLKAAGYHVETTPCYQTKETFEKLEKRIGKMPWNLIKPDAPKEIKEIFKGGLMESKLYDSDDNVVTCTCGKRSTKAIIGKDACVNYCEECDPDKDAPVAKFVYREPTDKQKKLANDVITRDAWTVNMKGEGGQWKELNLTYPHG